MVHAGLDFDRQLRGVHRPQDGAFPLLPQRLRDLQQARIVRHQDPGVGGDGGVQQLQHPIPQSRTAARVQDVKLPPDGTLVPPGGFRSAVQVRVGHLSQQTGTAEKSGDELLRLQAHVQLPEPGFDVSPVHELPGGGERRPVNHLVQRSELGGHARRGVRRQRARVPDRRAARALGRGRGLEEGAGPVGAHDEDQVFSAVQCERRIGAGEERGRRVDHEAAALEGFPRGRAAVRTPVTADVCLGDVRPQPCLLPQSLGHERRVESRGVRWSSIPDIIPVNQ